MKVVLYALSTCGWCKKTKQLLDENGVEYDLIYVDHLEEAEKERVLEIVSRWNPRRSFPTLVVDDAQSVNGFQEEQLRQVLGL